MLNVSFSTTLVNAPHLYQKQWFSELDMSYPGVCLYCVGYNHTQKNI